jgi:hypothetical protein
MNSIIENEAENFVLDIPDNEPILKPSVVSEIIRNCLSDELKEQMEVISKPNCSSDNLNEETNKKLLETKILEAIREAQKEESKRVKQEIFEITELNLSELENYSIYKEIQKIDWVVYSYLNEIDSIQKGKNYFKNLASTVNNSSDQPVKFDFSLRSILKSSFKMFKNILLNNSDLLLRSFHDKFLKTESNIIPIIEAALHSWSLIIVIFVFLLNLLENPCFLTVPPVLMLLLFGLLYQPFAPPIFWRICILYQMLLIVIKLGYHLPPFCLHKFTFAFSEKCYSFRSSMSSSFLLSPEFIGFAKPQVNNMIQLLLFDVLSLLSLLFHRSTLIRLGVWEFVCLNLGNHLTRFFNLSDFQHQNVYQYLSSCLRTKSVKL